MEGLILMLGGLLAGVLFAVVPVATALAGLVLDAIATAVSSILGRKATGRTPEPADQSSEPASRSKRKIFRRIAWVCASVALGYLLIVGILQLFFFKPAATALLERYSARADIEIEFADIRGNLFTGRFAIDQLKIGSAAADGGKSWKAEVRSAALDIDMLRLFGKRTWLDSLVVEEAKVEVKTTAAPDFSPIDAFKKVRGAAPKERYRERRRFGIDEMRLEKLELTWIRPASTQVLMVEHFDCEDLKSEYAVFQILFRSNAHGWLNETPWKIVTEETGPLARRTEWKFEGIPLGLAAEMAGGPFTLFEKGTLDVFVEDEWSLAEGDNDEIDLDWRFVFHGFSAETPESLADSRLANAVVDFVNDAANPLDIHFTLTWNKDDLRGSASLDTRSLVDAVTRSLFSPDTIESLKDKAKNLWDKLREKKKNDESDNPPP